MGPGLSDLWSGAMHYWRVPREHWGRCLDAIVDLGLPAVETYVPWGVHAVSPTRYDFTGQKDLRAFIAAASERGLRVILRPGPHINAELTLFGFPEWIAFDEEMQARTSHGTPAVVPAPPRMFPAPSYASKKFLNASLAWYDALAKEVADLAVPGGPIAALQVDNECAFFFRGGAFDQDYHPDAIAAWREETGEDDAPRAFDGNHARGLRWVIWKEQLLVRALDFLGRGLRERGFGGSHLLLYHNFPPGDPLLVPLVETERALGLCGIDLYHQAHEYDRVRRRMLYLSGVSRLPYAPELQSGGWLWWPPLTLADARTTMLGAFMHGLKAFNLYMIVDRDRWYGAPIAADGTRRPAAFSFLQRIIGTLRDIGWSALERKVEVAVVAARTATQRALASSLLDPVPPLTYDLFGLSLADVADDAGDLLEQDRMADTLTRAHVPFVFTSEERAERYPIVVRDAAQAQAAAARAARPFAAKEPEVDTALWGEDILFVGTRSPQALVAHLEDACVLKDLLDGSTVSGAEIPLDRFGVRIFRIQR